MITNYFKIAWRHIIKNKVYAFINISGLAVGMVVAILIGLWMWDEISFDRYNENYSRVAQVMQSQTFNGVIKTAQSIPVPLERELRKSYANDFKYISLSSWTEEHILSFSDKKVLQSGNYMQSAAPEMFGLHMLVGSRKGLNNPSSILLSASAAKALFGSTSVLDKTIMLDNEHPVKIAGIYQDLPRNTSLNKMQFIANWDLYASQNWVKNAKDDWLNNSFQLFVQVADHADMKQLSVKIKDAKLRGMNDMKFGLHSQLLLQPMSNWHLRSEFKNGINIGGGIQYIYMFGAIGLFVLLLACINFMNLSTARSEKRAKEVGILKSIGSTRKQLIGQFYVESFLITLMAFAVCIILVQTVLPFFNLMADKQVSILWDKPVFWLFCIIFVLFTALVAGSYPALYLSGFKPVSVLKGTFRIGRFAGMPRQALVVVQFAISVILIIGTLVVYRQIQHSKNRPVGYNRDGLITIAMRTNELHKHFDAFKHDLLNSGMANGVARSTSPLNNINNNSNNFSWPGKNPALTDDFGTIGVSQDYGNTVGWKFTEGRDFSKQLLTDSMGLVINEAAIKYTGLKNPVGKFISVDGKNYKILGVVKDMVMRSPYEPAVQTLFFWLMMVM